MVFYIFMSKTRFAPHGMEKIDGVQVRNRAGGKFGSDGRCWMFFAAPTEGGKDKT